MMRQVNEPIPPLEVSGLPAEAEQLVAAALAKDADARPTARQMSAELSRLK